MQFYFAGAGCRVMRRSSGQDRSDVRTAQMPSPVPLADSVRDRPQTAVPDCPTVDLHDREDATGSAAEEGLVGGVEIVRGEVVLRGGDTELGRNLENGLTS